MAIYWDGYEMRRKVRFRNPIIRTIRRINWDFLAVLAFSFAFWVILFVWWFGD